MKRILVGAHRGAMCYAPENTLAAFEKAIELGTYRIELDVRRCATGEIVVMHDATVARTTDGTGRVADMTLAELKRLKVGGTEPIPTLAEVLALARGRCKLLVEIKDEGIADDVVALIAAAGMVDACTLSSFSEETLLRVEAVNPAPATAYFHLRPGEFDPAAVVARLGVSLLVVWPKAAIAEQIAAAKRLGLHVRCGFPDNLSYLETWEEFRRLAAMGVDEMACGRPDWIAAMAGLYAEKQKREEERRAVRGELDRALRELRRGDD